MFLFSQHELACHMKMYHCMVLFAMCIGCTCRSTKNEPAASQREEVARDDRAEEKLKAFELIAAEFSKLPSSDEFYEPKPQWQKETMLKAVLERRAKIDGMLEIFTIISFDPGKHPEIAKKISRIYENTIDDDNRRQPYRVLVQQITESVMPILESTWPPMKE